jgi:hypothetical protein
MKRENIADELIEAMREAAASHSTRAPCRTGSKAAAVPTAPLGLISP